MQIVELYTDAEGRCPFEKWFDALDSRAALAVRTAVARMESGNLGDVKPVGEGVSERRINLGPGYRVYFGQDGPTLILLLVGGTKKRQQTDIEAAKRYWAEYKKRKADDGVD